jgi:hypothetical protein
MSDIASVSLRNAASQSLLALKLQVQQERAVVALVEEAVQSTQSVNGSPSSNGRLVDIVV